MARVSEMGAEVMCDVASLSLSSFEPPSCVSPGSRSEFARAATPWPIPRKRGLRPDTLAAYCSVRRI